MKVIVYTEYGLPDVLQLKEMKKPTFNNNEPFLNCLFE
jgi:hypothetical protein